MNKVPSLTFITTKLFLQPPPIAYSPGPLRLNAPQVLHECFDGENAISTENSSANIFNEQSLAPMLCLLIIFSSHGNNLTA